MVQAVELLILSLFSSSQVEELLILIHIEFNILAAEFVIAALLYLDLSLFTQQQLLVW